MDSPFIAVYGEASSALLHTALLLMSASVLRGLCTMVQNYQGEAVGHMIGYHLRLHYYRKLQTLSFSWHDGLGCYFELARHGREMDKETCSRSGSR